MLDPLFSFLAFSLGVLVGYSAYRFDWLGKIGKKFMPTKPTKAKRLGRKAHQNVTEAEEELSYADNDLKGPQGGNMQNVGYKLTSARLHISLARRILTALLGQGFDEDENGNNGHE